jgi:membrane fusion protein, multidrug efflux system
MNHKAILLITAFGLTLSGCSSREGTESETSQGREIEMVKVVELDYSEITRSATYTAHLSPYREVHLAPASPGRIEKIHVDAGSKVQNDQSLVEMDNTQLIQAQLQLQSIEKDFRRIDTLRRVGSVSQQQYDQIKTQYDVARSNVEFLSENTSLHAPFTGTISERYYEPGEMYSGAPNTAAGKAAILTLLQTNTLKALVNISERNFPYVHEGMQVMITTDVYPGESFPATIELIYPVIDPQTRSFRVELRILNNDEHLRPGMFARAHLGLDQVEAFVVPALAVLKLQGSNERYVFLEENGSARRVVVRIGDRFDDMVEIISDEIYVGDKLIIAGQARLLDGVAVQVQD